MDQDAGQSPTAAVNSSSAASDQAGAGLEGTLCPDPNFYDRSQASEARFFGATSGLLELRSSNNPPTTSPAIEPSPGTDSQSLDGVQQVGRISHGNSSVEMKNLDDLVAPELRDVLIDLYFEWEQPWFQLVDEALFRQSMLCNGRYSCPSLLHSMLAVASRYCDDWRVRSDFSDPHTAGRIFSERAEILLREEVKCPGIATIQALGVLGIYYVPDSRPHHSLRLQRAMITHCQILEKVLTNLYAPKRLSSTVEKRTFFDSCILTLKGWYYSLPNELKVRKSEEANKAAKSPHSYILNMVYHTSIILLARPYLQSSRKPKTEIVALQHLSEQTEVGRRASAACCEAAVEICSLSAKYRAAFGSFRLSPLTATHCTLSAALVILFVQPAVKDDVSKLSKNDLDGCLQTLRELSISWSPPLRTDGLKELINMNLERGP
ncbi:nitrogen assimilation transcription factor nirA [Colletotrichum simmondsii]|uniref:Nitrogen assimilation transcription factor nirA n=1 Tax=Colletotrichum simmondsii TaxID=703756 RepID=A0A135T274_9PEZI|nr:nitrogen assimilation transcription factor nirA [Colletotrichum simmondsii]